ncbi:DegT/DnrJ/EryC1/StrS family aminotransferase [Brachybacterium alimentarium]|uniref:Aminotransferase DegT n=1 Tax=Brachybacterium alimentarium TaxID=47845 RepID=A0A2A3YHF2_9MICO|nr:DegT/DnrJ/EryC1/StrS family aminotransferase [Brachybacterium alimentarium]PCC35657.1 aminotransferase DegT [Brachybacterium alimentarium]PCC39182.1 aminotransferase DegT [Brachybacterium alimentarium]RCS67962.1 DegT/DnrJ/EryC1/StrS family aminotransferase [Brachybacterium alimentarium]RCS80969.1 DegT/DnrJ/EryC1/StrS family aminotransferase [Brachybacterium alimentarium]RCS82505.1 DegT/DnrJ/EryC1/StrS family aminotransferase [Brachybacterium alimentarium]
MNTEFSMIPPAKPIIGQEERDAVDRVLASGMVAQGPEVEAFEQEFSGALAGGREVVAVNSGTSGQHLGMLALGLSSGDEVIVPSFTFAATANTVAVSGGTPVFVDVDPETFTLDPAMIDAAVTERTVGIQPVHLYGHPAAMDEIMAIAAKHDLWVFEDAAQAHGATWQGSQVGTFGQAGMFSLYPTKNMTSGEGGMVSCGTAETARQVRLLRNQGMEKQYANEVAGYNNRMTDIHAAIGRVQLGKLAGWTETRRENAAFFDAHLRGVVTPVVRDGAQHVYHQYTIRIEGASAQERDAFATALREEHRVGCGVYYPTPVHRLETFRTEVDLPVTEQLAREVLSLPVHPSITDQDRERIVAAVNTVAKAGA